MERAYERAPSAPIRRTSVPADMVDAVLSELGPAALGIYVYLAKRCNRDGECWPSYQTIADDCGVQRRYVMKVVASLEERQFIVVERRRSERTGNTENVYRMPAQIALWGGAHAGAPAGAHPGDLPIRKNVQRERTEEPTEEENAPAFAEFWLLYPKKRGKDAAQRAWQKLKADDRRLAFDRLPAFISCRQWQTDDGRFIPHPATWLNSGDWREMPDHGPARPAGRISGLLSLEVE